MTIAIAATWPWGRLARIGQNFQGSIPSGVILVSDSRWTIPQGSDVHHFDIGTKLFQIGGNVGAVYAGDVRLGEACLTRLERRVRKERVPKTKPPADFMRGLFNGVHTARGEGPDVSILVGVCDPGGHAEVWGFSSVAAFEPRSLKGVCMLANEEARPAVRAALYHLEEEAFSKGFHGQFGPDLGALWLMIAVKEHVIESGIDPTVGGSIQVAVIDQRGFRRPIAMRFRGVGEQPTWDDRLTPNPGELTTLSQLDQMSNGLSLVQLTD